MKSNILLTGGHAATTAISVIEEIKKELPESNLYWMGPRSAVEGKFVPTLASEIMPKMGVKFIPITTGRLQRRFTIWTIPSLLKIPFGVVMAFKVLLEVKPKMILAFGGYAAVPICFAGWILRIPIYIHEQTSAAGLANKISARFAKKIFIAREESRRYFPERKTVLIGNPVSQEITNIKPKTKISSTPIIYITGGSSGAQRINRVVKEALYDLVKKYKIIHQTGKLDFDEFKKVQNEFPTDLKKNYEVYDFIDPKEVPGFFDKADFIISRAGANTISEIMITKRPAILIPIPWTSNDEQTKNAKMAEKAGIARVLPESELNGNKLIIEIEVIIKNWKKMVSESDSTISELDKNAAKRFVSEIQHG